MNAVKNTKGELAPEGASAAKSANAILEDVIRTYRFVTKWRWARSQLERWIYTTSERDMVMIEADREGVTRGTTADETKAIIRLLWRRYTVRFQWEASGLYCYYYIEVEKDE